MSSSGQRAANALHRYLPRELRDIVYSFLWENHHHAALADLLFYPGDKYTVEELGLVLPPTFLQADYLGFQVAYEATQWLYSHTTTFHLRTTNAIETFVYYDPFGLHVTPQPYLHNLKSLCVHLRPYDAERWSTDEQLIQGITSHFESLLSLEDNFNDDFQLKIMFDWSNTFEIEPIIKLLKYLGLVVSIAERKCPTVHVMFHAHGYELDMRHLLGAGRTEITRFLANNVLRALHQRLVQGFLTDTDYTFLRYFWNQAVQQWMSALNDA